VAEAVEGTINSSRPGDQNSKWGLVHVVWTYTRGDHSPKLYYCMLVGLSPTISQQAKGGCNIPQFSIAVIYLTEPEAVN